MRIIVVVCSCVVLFNLVSLTVQGQPIPKEKIAGTWVCRKVIFLSSESLPDTTSQEGMMIVKVTREAFTQATFIFGIDSVFHLKFPAQVKNPLTQEFAMMNGKKWHWDAKNEKVDISPRENLMSMIMREVNGVTFFLLDETSIVLTMNKLTP